MKYLIVILLFLPALSFAQPAPDFLVTDSDGIQHRLYADYLDQDKTILIEIFFTTCPPCRSIASSVEIYYQEWGAGMHDVEFIELSNKSFDTDALVNAYKNEFGITYPSVGVDGGSLDAIVPYTNGTYGPNSGTPTFIVIGPDGEVNFDVDGQDLWTELDEALYATGAMKPGDDPDTTDMTPDPEPVEVEGRVISFADGAQGIGNAQVVVLDGDGGEMFRDTTDADGAYSFVIDSAVFADTDMFIYVEKSINPTNGVTATDLVQIQKHLLGLDKFDFAELLFASDANLSQSISATDLLFLKRLLLELEDGFADGLTWEFFHADVNLGPPTDQPPVLMRGPVSLQEIEDGSKSPDFKGIKRGDVNFSADNSN